jgi:subtilase family serine protease
VTNPHSTVRPRALPATLALLLLLTLLLSACSLGSTSVTGGATTGSSTGETPDDNGSGQGENSYSPYQMRVAYGVESLYKKGMTGKGQTVVLIESFGSPTLQRDVDVFSQKFNLPKITVKQLAPLGTKPFDPTNNDMVGWAYETTEDVEIIHAMAPDAGIVVLSSPVAETEGVTGFPEFLKLMQYARDNKLGSVVSQSYGASEISLNDDAGKQLVATFNDFYQKTTTENKITFFASSGDGGASDYASAQDFEDHQLANERTTSFPHDSPWVTSVGGTLLTIRGSSVSETAWQDSGGGFSQFFSTPSYQQQLSSATQTQFQNRRGVPDVASSADVDHGMAMYVFGRWAIANGTSAGSPLWAALTAIADQMAGHPLGFINPAIYKIGASDKATQDFRDITKGNNNQLEVGVQGYPAVAGWDPVTGFGSPIADKLLPDLIAATS